MQFFLYWIVITFIFKQQQCQMLVFSQKQTFCKHLRPCWQNHFSTDEAVLWSPSNSVFSSLCPTFSPRPFPTALSEPAQFCFTAPANKHVSKGPRFSSLHEIYGPKMEGYVLWCDCFIISRMYLVDFSLSLTLFFFWKWAVRLLWWLCEGPFWISDISDSNILDKYLDHFEQVSSIYELILFV